MLKEVFAVMAARRTCKRYTPRPVELDKLLQIIQAGALAPSSGNIQNWSFTLITDIDLIRSLYHHTLEQEPFLSAMAGILVCGDVNHAHTMYGLRGKRLYTTQNCAAAIENMLLAATALNLGSTWIGAFDEDAVSEMFGVPNEKHRPQAIILFGYPAEEPLEKETRFLDNIVFYNKFGNRVKRPHLMYLDWATEWKNMAKKLRVHFNWAKHDMQKKKESKEEKPSKRSDAMGQLKEFKNKSGESFDDAKKKISDVFKGLKK